MPHGSAGDPTRALNGGSEHGVLSAPNREQLTHHPNKFSPPSLYVAQFERGPLVIPFLRSYFQSSS